MHAPDPNTSSPILPAPRARRVRAALAALPAALLVGTLHPQPAAAAGSRIDEARLEPGAKAWTLSDFRPCRFPLVPVRGDDALCATFVVPENHDRPNGRLLALPLVRLPARGPKVAEPVFWLSGGPGHTNLDYHVDGKSLAQEHDVYMLGYRGAEGSQVLQCPEMTPALAAPKPISSGLTSQAARACAARLTASGVDLTRYSMFDVVRDHEGLRKALKARQVSLISRSYGTRIAQYYTRVNPRSVRRSVLIAANPPGHFHWYPEATNEILALYAERCAASPACSRRTPDLARTVLSGLAKDDVTYNGAPVDMEKARILANMLFMSSKRGAQMLFDIMIAAENGDYGPMAKGIEGFETRMAAGFIWGDTFSKGGGDKPLDTGDYRAKRQTTSSSFGAPLGLMFDSARKGWPRRELPPGFDRPALDRTPTLLISGNLDASTPARYARDELLPHLPNGRFILLSDVSHEELGREHSTAVGELVAGFLRDGTVDESGLGVFKPVTLR